MNCELSSILMDAALIHCSAEKLAFVRGANSVNIYSQIKMKIYWPQRVFGAAESRDRERPGESESAAVGKRLSDSD